MTPYGERWVQVYKEVKGCPIRAAAIMGCDHNTAMLWRRQILGPTRRVGGYVADFNADNIEELRAALEARVSPARMAHRFGVSHGTLRNVINQYGLPRIRKPRTPKHPSKAW